MANVLKYDPKVYIPHITMAREFILPDVDVSKPKGKAAADRLLRQEYSRLRAIAQKRLERLSRSEFKNDVAYQRYQGRFRKLTEMRSMRQVAESLSDIASFLSLKTSTIKGAQETQRNILAGMHARGYTFVSEVNLREFGEFMDLLRAKLLDRIYDSERAYKVFEQARRLGMKWHGDLEKEFDFFYKNYEKMEDLRPLIRKEKTEIRQQTGKARMRSAEYYRHALENWKPERLSHDIQTSEI